MVRVILFLLSFGGGIAAIAWALLAPVHLRAVDEQVLAQLDKGGSSIVETAQELLPQKWGTAKVMQGAAATLELPGAARLASSIRSAANTAAAWQDSPFQSRNLQSLLAPSDHAYIGENLLFDILKNRITREKFIQQLGSPDARAVIDTASLTNTALFAPAPSAAGVPLEIAILSTALLVEEKAFAPAVKNELLQSIASASRTNVNPVLEEFYLNVFVLSRRLTWEQITAYVAPFQSAAAFDYSVRWLQENNREFSIFFTALQLSQKGDLLVRYLRTFPERGIDNITLALSKGEAALLRVLEVQQPVYSSGFRDALLQNRFIAALFRPALSLAVQFPGLAIGLKILLIFLGGFLIALSGRFITTPAADGYVFFPRFNLVRQTVFAILLLAAVIIIGEPYLAYAESKEEPPRAAFNFAALANITPQPLTPASMLNASTIVALSFFFLLQTALYIVCLTKLAEIRKQPLSSTMKLRLLDNEDNLFDSGLYAGLFGTALSLVLLTLGIIKPSLMAAYASTLFGILFVSVVKIVHLRPFKRRLIIDSQSEAQPA